MRNLSPLLLALALTAVHAAPGGGQALDATVGDDIGIEQRLDEQVPLDLTFVDAAGMPVRLGDLLGSRPAVLSLVYYECPMLCTQVLNGLLRTLRALSLEPGTEFDIITVSIDPGDNTELARAKKHEYVSQYGRQGAQRGWHFLTGEQAQIDRLAEAVGFHYRYDEDNDLYVHASGIMVLTPKGRVARYFYGVEYSIKDLRLGLVEAAEERIGSPVDQLLLLCMQYDPATGKYGLAIMNSLRLAGGATVALTTLLVIGWLRRERAQTREASRGDGAAAPSHPNMHQN